jgi:membrane peptidoglycan carboxypeptidase
MNSYGDPQSARARARVPGPSAASTPDDDQASARYPDEGRPAPDAYRRGAGGRGTVGSAPVGSAPSGRAPIGSAAVGAAPVGSARVGGRASVGTGSGPIGGRASVGSVSGPIGGRASVGSGSGAIGGRASVGTGSGAIGGRAAVARAAVRPGGEPGYGGFGGPPNGPGGDGPGTGAGGRGRGGKDRSKAAKRRRRTNILTAAAAVVVILLGAGVVGGTYFFDSVSLPEAKTENQSNVILDAKGTVLAKVGDQNRTVVPENKINPIVEKAVAAAEDKNFYTHHGIDMKGIVRAAWNNFTGGTTQGASTITQQYARHVANLKAISINRKLREAVIARKLESQYNKEQIMGMYLNFVDLGEGRYGIEAAAQGYFGKSVLTPQGQKGAITPYEAAVLASIIKQPYPTATHKGYDPNYNPGDAKARWEYTLNNMLQMGWISQAQYDARKYPKVKPRNSDTCKTCADDKPVGMIIRHVRAELNAAGIGESAFDRGGLTITTTIDPVVQKAAEEAGSRKSKESPMYKRTAKMQAAVIGIDPNTGRVLGYYGGDNPDGTDYGGYMSGDGSKILGGQSPGSSFKIYTLAAGLKQDLSFDSVWDGTKRRPNGTEISNAGADPGKICSGKIKFCDLETATIKSYNFPFYWIADTIGRDKVIQAAKDAGLKHLFTDDLKMVDLTKTDASTWKQQGMFDNEVAFGQYHVVPLEHAEGVATIVNGGVHHAAHFIKSVKRVDADTGKKETILSEKVDGNRVFPEDQMSNLQGVLAKIPGYDNKSLRNGRDSIAKSGTWEYKEGSGDCWFVGGIPQLAATVWVGGAGNKIQLKETNGHDMFGAGTPASIWKKFIDTVTAELDLKREEFPERIKTGDPAKLGNGQAPPPPPANQGVCLFGVIGNGCDNNGGGNNGNGNGNGGGGNNGGGNNNGGGGNNNGGGGGNNNGGGGGNTDLPTLPTLSPQGADTNNSGGD